MRVLFVLAVVLAAAVLGCEHHGHGHHHHHHHDHDGHGHHHGGHDDHHHHHHHHDHAPRKTGMYSRSANAEAAAAPVTSTAAPAATVAPAQPAVVAATTAAPAHDHHHDHHDHHDHDHDHHDCGHDHSFDYSQPKARDLSWATVWAQALGATLLISAAPLVVLYFVPVEKAGSINQPVLKVLLAFAAGGLLGDTFLHLLPHAGAGHHDHGHHDHHGHHGHDHDHHHHGHGHEGHNHAAELGTGLWVLAGIMVFLVIEKVVRAVKGGHGHSHSADAHGHSHVAGAKAVEDAKKVAKTDNDAVKKTDGCPAAAKDAAASSEIKVAGYLNLAADAAHNFTDGLAIGASFAVDQRLALITTFTVLLHEVPHEIGDFAILIQSGCSRRAAMLLQLTTAVGALVGTVCGLLSSEVGQATAWVLPFTAGGFIYVACVSVLPELLGPASLWQSVKEMAAMALGVATMVLIVFIE